MTVQQRSNNLGDYLAAIAVATLFVKIFFVPGAIAGFALSGWFEAWTGNTSTIAPIGIGGTISMICGLPLTWKTFKTALSVESDMRAREAAQTVTR